ncbi:MAG: TonB family protein, partial [Polyangiaceae bacterium]
MKAVTRAWAALPLAALLLSRAPDASGAGGPIVPPRRLDTGEAPYPSGASGDARVVLVVVVDGGGEVTDVTVRDGATPFAEAAVAAVRAWRFSPAMKVDTAVAAKIVATVTFRAPVRASPPARPGPPPVLPITPAPSAPPAAPLEPQEVA